MRISSSMLFDSGVASMQKQNAALLHTQQQVSTGRRILTPSDDPVAAARALEVDQARAINVQYLANQKTAGESLGLVEGNLAAAGNLLGRVREIAVQSGNTALSGADRKSLAFELRQRFDELLGIANATDGTGQYLFSGYMGDTTPFSGSVAAGVAYAGDEGRRQLQVSASRQIAISDSGSDVFMRIRNGNGSFATGVNAANTGSGVIDAGQVLNPALATGHGYSIGFAMAGSTLNYTVTDTTTAAVVATAAYQAGSAIAFDGISVTLSGAPAAGDTFTVAPSSSQSLFTTVADLIASLEAPAGTASGNALLANRIGFALTNLDQGQDNLLRVRASVGARMQEIDSQASAGEDLNLQYQQVLSRLQDVDYAAAVSQLTQEQGYLEAAQKSFLKVTGLSLFNYV